MGISAITAPTVKTLFQQQLINMILEGEILPGERIPPEREMAEQAHISKATVHLAVSELERLGFLESRGRNGMFVRNYVETGTLETLSLLMNKRSFSMDEATVADVLEMRFLLESRAIERLCGRMSGEVRGALAADLAAAKAIAEQKTPDAGHLAQSFFRFHRDIFVFSGNMVLSILYNSFEAVSLTYWTEAVRRLGPAQCIRHMERLLADLDAADAKSAVACLRAQLELFFARVRGGTGEEEPMEQKEQPGAPVRFGNFSQLLQHWARRTPQAPALRFEGETLSFSALWERVLRRADELRAGQKSCLGLLADGSLACVIELFAAAEAGLQIVMLDPGQDAGVLGEQVHYTDADCLWGPAELVKELTPHLASGVEEGKGKILFFTSGTTDRAKAVVLTQESLCQSAWNGASMLPLSPEDTLLCMLPLSHVFGFVCGLLWGLSCGACVALGRGARHYLDDCAFYRPTAVSVVPVLLGFLIRQRCVNPELKMVLVGAGDCPPELLQAAASLGLRVSFGYGLTETSSGVAISVSGDPFSMAVCPDDTITLAPDSEILVRAPTCMMQGYYKYPEATREVLRDGVLFTGDLGRFDENGRLHITGRKKEILVLPDGTKVFLPEYEADLARLLGHTELAVAQKDGRLVLLCADERAPDEIAGELKKLMRRLPRGQQIAQVLVTGQPLPRTAAGKLRRQEIQKKVSEQA